MTKKDKLTIIAVLIRIRQEVVDFKGLYLCPLVEEHIDSLGGGETVQNLKKLLWKNRVGCKLRKYTEGDPWWPMDNVLSRVSTINATIKQLKLETFNKKLVSNNK